MLSGMFFLAVVLIGISITVIQWFFVGFLFHKYQALTPSTWRKEGPRSYAASSLLALVFACLFTIVFYLWKSKYGVPDVLGGVEFGALCWLTFSIPAELGSAIYVNFSRMFTVGKCISSLFEYVVAGVIAFLVL
jgi:hypothetical protein